MKSFFKIYYDGTKQAVDMSDQTTLQSARQYFIGHQEITENFETGEETVGSKIIDVQEYREEIK